MDRRQFIKNTALAGVALGTTSCSSLKFLPTGDLISNPPNMEAYLALMDEGMHQLSAWNPVDDFTGTTLDTPTRKDANRLARNAYKSLYVTAMFSELSPDDQLHPEMQARMESALPHMHASALEMEEFFAEENPEKTAALRGFLNQKDDPGQRFLDHFNGHAEKSGVTSSRRAQTRVMTSRILWRLKHQSPDLIIEETNAKMDKLEASSGTDAAIQHTLAKKVSEKAFWKWQESCNQPGSSGVQAPAIYNNWTEAGAKENSQDDDNSREILTKPKSKKKPEKPLAARASKQMGIGLGLLAGGGLVVAAGGWPGVFVMTVGAIYFLIGLIRLMAAGVQGSAEAEPQSA